MFVITGFLIGFLGSLHCVGMCGPLVIALSPQKKGTLHVTSSLLFMQMGRLASYILLGLIVGWLGEKLMTMGLQRTVSITAGLLMMAYPILFYSKYRRWFEIDSSNASKIFWRWGGALLRHPNPLSQMALGFLNGLLPCSLVYLALTASLTVGTYFDGLLYMLAFGLGTIPAILGTGFVGSLILEKWRGVRWFSPLFVMLVAFLLIFRGVLIPYMQ